MVVNFVIRLSPFLFSNPPKYTLFAPSPRKSCISCYFQILPGRTAKPQEHENKQLGQIQCIMRDSIIDNKEMHENRVLSVTLRKRVFYQKSISCVVGQWFCNTNFLPSPSVTGFGQKRHCLSSLLSLGQGKNSQASEKILNIQGG